MIQPGQTLGPYRVIEQVGQGGMATVYKAYHPAMDRQVALKVLPRQFAEDPEFLGRFRQEARTIARLEHPHILPVYDYGESDGYTFLVMRYLEAGTLRSRIASAALAGGLSLPQIDHFFSQVADALDYAHSHGVVHRDVKPANVLIDGRGSAFLTDFGIARLVETTSNFTGTGVLIGTPSYMSPEQGQGARADARSDIYSLGVILYEMLTGRVPFQAETPAAVIFKHVYEPLPLPTTLRPNLNPAIEQLILKALAKNPADRFSSTADFLAAWKQNLGPTPVSASSPTLERSQPTPPPTLVGDYNPTAIAPPPTPPPAAVYTPPPPPAEPTPLPARSRTRPLLLLSGLGLFAFLAFIVVVAFVVIRFVLPNLPNSASSDDEPPALTDNGENPPPVELPPLFATDEASSEPVTQEFATILLGRDPIPATDTGDLEWTTWSFANEVTHIAIHGDELVAGASGNLTIWDRRDGTLLHQFTLNDGLPGPQVKALWVDLDGTLWVGADSGLGRYDPESQQWQHYDESDGLEQELVHALLRTSGGTLLIGTLYGTDGDGLVLFDGEEFTRFPGFPSGDPAEGLLSNTISTLFEDGSGNLWVGTYAGQVGRFDGDEWTIYTAEDAPLVDEIRAFTLDATGRLWVGADQGVAVFEGDHFQPVTGLPTRYVFGLFTDSQGYIWITGSEPSIIRYDPANEEWQEYPNDYSFSAAEDSDGNVYLATGSGLMRVDGDELVPWLVPNVPGANYYEDILQTPDGDLLFVDDMYTSQLFDPETESWSTLPDQINELPCCPIPRAYDSQGRLWATEAGRVWILTDDQPLAITGEHGLPPDAWINDIAFYPDGGAAIATEAGLALWDGETIFSVRTVEDGSGMSSNNVTAVLITTDDNGESTTWLGTEGGLSRIDPNHVWTHYTVGDPFGPDFQYISDLAQAPDGTIWVATEGDINGDGLYRFEADDIDHFYRDDGFSQIGSDHIYTLHIAPDGSLWFTPSYNGAVRYDGQTWTLYDALDNLLLNNVADVLVDDTGTVWFSTSFGIVRFRP